MKACLALLVVAATLAWSSGIASAERWIRYTQDGYRCEQVLEGDLGKAVCRNPSAPQTDWFVCFFQHHPYVSSPLRNCFTSGGLVTTNDAPSLYLSNNYPDRRELNFGNGMPCFGMQEASLAKLHCWNPDAPNVYWVVCMFERANGVVFGDCMNSENHRWSEQLPRGVWPS